MVRKWSTGPISLSYTTPNRPVRITCTSHRLRALALEQRVAAQHHVEGHRLACLLAVLAPRPEPRHLPLTRRPCHAYFASRLSRDGTEASLFVWLGQNRVLQYSAPPLSLLSLSPWKSTTRSAGHHILSSRCQFSSRLAGTMTMCGSGRWYFFSFSTARNAITCAVLPSPISSARIAPSPYDRERRSQIEGSHAGTAAVLRAPLKSWCACPPHPHTPSERREIVTCSCSSERKLTPTT
jgi:hypothetical protein